MFIAILEIFIFFAICFTIITYFFKDKILALTNDYARNSSDTTSPDLVNGGFNSYFTGLTNNIFKDYAGSFMNIFGGFSSIFNIFQGNIDKIRSFTLPIRNFFRNMAMKFYKTLEKGMITITYLIHKLRNALRRSLSGFNLAVHTVDHTLTFFDAFYNSPLIPTMQKLDKPFNFVADKFYKAGKVLRTGYIKEDFKDNICFHPDTLLYLNSNSYKPIKSIQPGDIIRNHGFHIVIGLLQFSNSKPIFNYNNILVSDSHLVLEDDKWKRISNSPLSFKTNETPDTLFCLITNTHKIPINEFIFSDFIEVNNPYTNKSINDIILSHLNNNSSLISNKFTQYNYPGFAKDTLVFINETDTKPIQELQIGDKILGGTITGKIEFLSYNIPLCRFKNLLLTESSKVLLDDIWYNVIDLHECIDVSLNTTLYNLVVDSQTIFIKTDYNYLLFRDFFETHNPTINNQINNILEEDINRYL